MAIVHFGNYQMFKARMDQEMTQTADSFVRIGYLLKEARDTNVLAGSGYTSMGAWAQAEYGLTESQTSRFIAICERFGDGGDRLLPQYSSIGYTKLSEMLTLPDHIVEALPESVTREQLRELKADYQEEMETTDIERLLEPQTPEGEIVEAFFRELFAGDPVLLARAFSALLPYRRGEQIEVGPADMVMDMIAPSGVAVLSARVSGRGKLMLTINGNDRDPALVAERSGERFAPAWGTLQETLQSLLGAGETPEETWTALYGTAYPLASGKEEEEPEETWREETAEIAPAQEHRTERPEHHTAKAEEKPERAEGTHPIRKETAEPESVTEEASAEPVEKSGGEVIDMPEDPAAALYPTEDDEPEDWTLTVTGDHPTVTEWRAEDRAEEAAESVRYLRDMEERLRAGEVIAIYPREDEIAPLRKLRERMEHYEQMLRKMEE